MVNCSQEEKERALAMLCARQKTAAQISEELGVSRAVLYKWRRKLLIRERDLQMPKRERGTEELQAKNAALIEELQRVKAELEEMEKKL